jgi:hypothetical protein
MHSDLDVLKKEAQTLAKDGKYSDAAQLCTRIIAALAAKPSWVSTNNSRFINHSPFARFMMSLFFFKVYLFRMQFYHELKQVPLIS